MGKNFRNDLKIGQEGEQALALILKTNGCKNVEVRLDDFIEGLSPEEVADQAGWDISFTSNSTQHLAEVKTDRKFSQTGNVAIEFGKVGQGLNPIIPSGITATKSDVWYYRLGTEFWGVPALYLYEFIQQNWNRYYKTRGGDEKNTWVFLIPKDDFVSIATFIGKTDLTINTNEN